jgi:ribonuclease HII
MMMRAAAIYPAYGFESHMGYGSAKHLAAIMKHGPCPLHRMSFRPLRID